MRKNRDWGYNSVVKHLPSMHKALGSIPSTAKKKVEKSTSIQSTPFSVIFEEF
jgi:hypothetical protein